jgi:hypothetical protein
MKEPPGAVPSLTTITLKSKLSALLGTDDE